MALATSCDDRDPVRNVVPIPYDYALALPPEFVRQEIGGIDSKVEVFHSPGVIVSTDFGHHSAPPRCTGSSESCEIHSELISGRDALVGLYRHGLGERHDEPKPFRVFVHVRVDERQGVALNLFARCDTQRDCDEALRHFRQVRLLRTNPPPYERAPPPPPPLTAAPADPD
jgi:hypothetical protein